MSNARLFTPISVLFLFFLDRITKHWILQHMALGESIPVLPFFHLTYIENTGIAFGLGQERNVIFTIVAAVLLAALFFLKRYWEKRYRPDWRLQAGLSLVIAGAIGNLYDRIAYGAVVDFLDFFAGAYHWPAFNVADSCICVGAFLLAFSRWVPKETPQPVRP